MARTLLLSCFVCLFAARLAAAQAPAPAPAPGAAPAQSPAGPPGLLRDLLKSVQNKLEVVTADHWHFDGQVRIDPQNGTTFYADQVDIFWDTNRLVAEGNVVFTNPDGQIAAEKVEFDLGAGTGTFYQASGIMSLGAAADLTQFANQQPDVYFWGETVDKVTAKQYRISKGTFTTCVQPTPRWEIASGDMVLNLDEYAVARHTVLKVKGVPLMYLPVIYYPIQDDDRATGFLLPTYGTSTFRGQAISNAFFWALGRSHDATFFHDWFTRAGQGAGAEYRYVAAPQSSGNVRLYRFNRNQTEYTVDSGEVQALPANTSFEIVGNAVPTFAPRMRGRVRVDYFSDVVSQQLLHQNLYEATRRNRIVEGGLTNGFGPITTNVLYSRNEVVDTPTRSSLYGSTPRISANVAPQRLFNSPVYASLNTEFGFLPYEQRSDGAITSDTGFGRYDVSPSIRMPLSRLTFLSVNTSAGFRTTYYTRSFDPTDEGISSSRDMIDEPFLRRYASVRTEVVGPVFTRIWDVPERRFAERLKHVIEPAFTADVTSAMGDYRRTPFNTDISDFVVGGATRLTYGLTNRLFYRGRTVDGVRGQTREFVTVGLQQTYYSNPDASQSDTSYQSTLNATNIRDLSPVALTVRVSPSALVDANARVEYDVSGGGLQVFSTGGSLTRAQTSASLNFSRRRFDRTRAPDDFVSASLRTQLFQRSTTGTYSISWDLGRGYVVSQSVVASYMAQCCGLQVEFQQYNFQASSGIPLPSDRRLNFGFVLAGLGTFSNFFGAFGGQQP